MQTTMGYAVTLANLNTEEGLKASDAWVERHINVDDKEVQGEEGGHGRQVVGLDCEWRAPWFRAPGEPERVCTVQLAADGAVLLARVVAVTRLPTALSRVVEHPGILKVGVNVRGDCERLRRDFQAKPQGLHELSRNSLPASLHGLAQRYLGVAMDKDKAVSCSNWAQWPLSQRQVDYACADAIVAYRLFHEGPEAIREREAHEEALVSYHEEEEEGGFEEAKDNTATERIAMSASDATAAEGPSAAPSSSCCSASSSAVIYSSSTPATISTTASTAMTSDFYRFMRNKTMAPPNKGKKVYPPGDAAVLKGKVFVISGVLDSFDRSDCASYITRHGGAVRSSITKHTTHLLHDHGEVGPRKIKEAERLGIPIIGEDVLLAMVAGTATTTTTGSGCEGGEGGSRKRGAAGGKGQQPKRLRENKKRR